MRIWKRCPLIWKHVYNEKAVKRKILHIKTPRWRVRLGKLNTSLFIPEISRFLWHMYVHYRSHTSLLLVPVLSKVNPVRILPSCLNTYLSVILPYLPIFN